MDTQPTSTRSACSRRDTRLSGNDRATAPAAASLLRAHDRLGAGWRGRHAGGVVRGLSQAGQLDDGRPLNPWLFRIAHNRCIDFLRRREVRQEAEAAAVEPDSFSPSSPRPGLGRAVERLVVNLPPMERACVLLKDIFDYSLEEIADLVDSTIGGVKAALNRGRGKLAALQDAPRAGRASPEMLELLRPYIDRFNRRDWDGVRELDQRRRPPARRRLLRRTPAQLPLFRRIRPPDHSLADGARRGRWRAGRHHPQ